MDIGAAHVLEPLHAERLDANEPIAAP